MRETAKRKVKASLSSGHPKMHAISQMSFEKTTKEREDFLIGLGCSLRSAHDYCRSMNIMTFVISLSGFCGFVAGERCQHRDESQMNTTKSHALSFYVVLIRIV